MKKLIALLIVLMLSMGVALAECPCADGYDLATGQYGGDAKADYLSQDTSLWGLKALVDEGRLCLHGNELFMENGQAGWIIEEGKTAYFHDCVGYGKMYTDTAAFTWAMFRVDPGCTLIIDGGFYEAQGSGAASVAIANSGTVILHDAVITGNPVL